MAILIHQSLNPCQMRISTEGDKFKKKYVIESIQSNDQIACLLIKILNLQIVLVSPLLYLKLSYSSFYFSPYQIIAQILKGDLALFRTPLRIKDLHNILLNFNAL